MNLEIPIFKKIWTHFSESWITMIQIVICLILFTNYYSLSTNSSLNLDEVYKLSGYAQPTDIYKGQYWSLFISNFLHFNILHLFLNLYWLYILGHKIEKELTKFQYLLLVFSGGFIASLSELSFSGQLGIGYSGIGYTLFGFIYIKSKFDIRFKGFLPQKTINLFFIWLFFCVITTYTSVWNVGNAAHFSGLLWGILIACLSQIRSIFLRYALPFSCILILTSFLFYAPWSVAWLSYKAFENHSNQNIKEAKMYYNKILGIDKKYEFAIQNLKQIEIHDLSVKANELFESNNLDSARFVYNQILKIDSTNSFAIENLKLIEIEEKN